MRCIQCDANDQGMSLFRGDVYTPTSFHSLPNGDCLCGECYGWAAELESDYYQQDEVDDEAE